jgi:hypothetical protein
LIDERATLAENLYHTLKDIFAALSDLDVSDLPLFESLIDEGLAVARQNLRSRSHRALASSVLLLMPRPAKNTTHGTKSTMGGTSENGESKN